MALRACPPHWAARTCSAQHCHQGLRCLIASAIVGVLGLVEAIADVKYVFKALCAAALLALKIVCCNPALAQSADQNATASASQDLRVITRVVPPFVMKEGSAYAGFSVDLWQAIAKNLNMTFHFVEKPTVKDILAGMENREGDVAIAAISITAQREQEFDFSQPMFESGLQIMVRSDGNSGLSLAQVITVLTSGAMPFLLLLLAAMIIIPAHLAWWVERKHEQRLFSDSYFPGIFQAIWWATGAAAGQQPDHPRSSLGRVLSAMAILASVVFMAYFTAALTSALTVQTLKGDINGPHDLPGRKVGTTTGSTAADYLEAMNLKPLELASIEEVFAALNDKRIDAVVFDVPVLLYYAAGAGRNKVELVGPLLRRENYGILFSRSSTLRKPVNEALLRLREDGTYDAIYNKWFSATSPSGTTSP